MMRYLNQEERLPMFRKLLFIDLTFTDIHTLYSDPREEERFFFDLKGRTDSYVQNVVIPTA